MKSKNSIILLIFLLNGFIVLSQHNYDTLREMGFNDTAIESYGTIIKSMHEYKMVAKELDEIAEGMRSQVSDEYDEVKDMYNKYMNEQELLSEEQRTKKENEIMAAEAAVRKMQKSYFAEGGKLSQKRDELVTPVQVRLFEAILALSENTGYDEEKIAGILDFLDSSEDMTDAMNYLNELMGINAGSIAQRKDGQTHILTRNKKCMTENEIETNANPNIRVSFDLQEKLFGTYHLKGSKSGGLTLILNSDGTGNYDYSVWRGYGFENAEDNVNLKWGVFLDENGNHITQKKDDGEYYKLLVVADDPEQVLHTITGFHYASSCSVVWLRDSFNGPPRVMGAGLEKQ